MTANRLLKGMAMLIRRVEFVFSGMSESSRARSIMTKPPSCRLSTRPNELASSSATMAPLSEAAAEVVRPVRMSVARSPWLRSDLLLEERFMRTSSSGPDSDTSMMTPETRVVPRTSSSG